MPESTPDSIPPEPKPERLAELRDLVDLLTPHAIRVAVTLGVPELIHDGLTDIESLAEHTDTDTLRSLLHHLATRGVLHDLGNGHFTLTEIGPPTNPPPREDHARPARRRSTDRPRLDWTGLAHTVRTGGPGYALVHGRPFWEHITSDPALADSFDHYMRAGTATWTPTAAAAPVWPESGTVIDVGDGIGLLLADVLHTHPHLRSFLCEHHAGQVPSATPMTQEDVAELAERRAQHHRALAGQPYQPPNPIKD